MYVTLATPSSSPNLQSALKAYSNKALSYSKSIKDVLDRQYNIELLIKQLNK